MAKLHLPSVPKRIIDTPAALDDLCTHLRAAGRFAFDTEFIGENTYYPVLCLVQVATVERVDLVDPFAIDDLSPLWSLINDPAIPKIVHAGDQDVEIVWQKSGAKPQNVFDTQIAAGMIGLAYPAALWRVVEFYAGITLDKAHTYSAWDRRPLSKDQLTYAVDDVRYLLHVHDVMTAKLESLGRTHWQTAACTQMIDENCKPVDARGVFARIKGANSLDGDQLAVLRELTAWREQVAYEHDLPPRAMIADEALFDVAKRLPRDVDAVKRIKTLGAEDARSYGPHLVDLVKRGLTVPPDDRPELISPGEDSLAVKRLSEALWVAAQTICLGQSVTPGLVTSQNEVAALARLIDRSASLDKHPLTHGWHHECLGQHLAALVKGQRTVAFKFGPEGLEAQFS